MGTAATRRYTGQGLKPHMLPNRAWMDAIRLIPGVYVAGQVLGQFSTWTAANDVQTITIDYTPTGGSFYLNFDGVIIGPVAYNASAAALQALLDAASNIGTGQTVVTGGALPGTPLVVTFSGTLMKNLWQPLMTIQSNALTGGTPGTVEVAHTTEGRGVGGMYGKYDDTLSTGLEVARCLLSKACTVNTYGEIIIGGGRWDEKSFTADAYFGGYFRTADLTGIDANAVADLGKLVTGTTSLLANTGTILHVR